MAEYTAEELGLGGYYIDFDADIYNELIRAIHKFPDDHAGTYTAEEYMPHIQKVWGILSKLTPKQRDLFMMATDDDSDGRLPYVKAYLMNKLVLMYLLINYAITNKKVVFNYLDQYGYSFADYALKRKDHKFLLWIKSHGGSPHHFTKRGAKVENEKENNIDPRIEDLATVIFNNDDYKKIIKLLQKQSKEGAIRGFHGTPIALRRPPPLPVTSKKLLTYNNKKYGMHTFRKNKYSGRKDILMPVNLSTIDEWTTKQHEYITESPRRQFIVNSYSHHGDVLVNKFMRGQIFHTIEMNNGSTVYVIDEHVNNILTDIVESATLYNVPFAYQVFDLYNDIFKDDADINGKEYPMKESFGTGNTITNISDFLDFCKYYMYMFKERNLLIQLLQNYAEELNSIIRNAPRLPHSITTYRGSTGEYHIPKGVREYTHSGFTSTSLNPSVAFNFTRTIYPTVSCCIYELSIPQTIPVIYLESVTEHQKEYEILMPLDVRVQASDKLLLKRLYGREDRILVREVTVKGIHRGSNVTRLKTHGTTMRKLRFKSHAKTSKTHKNRVPAGGAGRGNSE